MMIKKNNNVDSLSASTNLLKKYMLTIANPHRSRFRTRLAIALDVSEDYLRAIEAGAKHLQPWMADTIEEYTNGKITVIQVYRAYSGWQKNTRSASRIKNAPKTHHVKTINQHVQQKT